MNVQKSIKDREDSLKEAYQKVLEVGLGNRSIDDLSSFIEHNVMGYGTARDEKIRSITEFIELIQLQRKQSINFDDFHYTSKPVLIRFTDNSYTAVVVDEIELVSVIGNDSNKLDLRMTSVFNFIDGAWKLIHWHGSTAEHVSDGEDPWHVNEWKKKTEKLEQMVEEKTVELIEKNKELEIEASLERVRAVAMGMNKSDDLLSICEISYKEFRKLGFDNIRNALIHIQYDEQKYFMDYDFSDLTGGAITKIEYGSHPVVEDYVKQIRSAKDAFYQGVIKEEQLEEWKNFRRNSGQIDDPRLDKATALYYYFFSIGIGDIGISALEPINESQIKILKRFRNVFDLAYRRYNDIALAEAQARETQIQLALERVRARTMAMQSSNELKEVVLNLFDGLKSLGVDPTVCNIVLIDKKTCDSDVWSAHQTDTGLITYRVFISHFEHPFRKKLIDSFLNKISFSVHELSGDLKKSYIQYLINRVDYSKVPDEVTKSNEKLVNIEEGIVLSAAYMKYGLLIVSRSHAISDDESDILQRFAKIFEQTYTRFLDLQRAEAQAREAQIETALEKVRSRSLAMHKSDELKQVVTVLFERLNELDIPVSAVGISIYIEDSKDLNNYVCGQNETGIAINNYRLSYFDHKIANDFFEVREKGLEFFEGHYSKDEKDSFYEYVIEHSQLKDELPDDIKQFVFQSPFYTISVVATKHAMITINDFEGGSLSDHEIDILKRFSKVFDQAYIRFLDLQKAEAQAREAQIELSMERIRAQVTAMRESSELLDIVVTMRSEFVALGHEAHYFWHMRYLPDKYEKAMTSGDGTRIGMVMTLPRHIHGDIKLIADWEKSNEPTIVFAMDVDTAVGYIEKMISLGDFQQVDPQAPTLDDIRHIGGLTFIMARTTHGEIGYSLPGTIPDPPKESLETLARFAGVFDLAYKRFEDLKITERQHREAQIELALERTRTQSIMMQHSSELNDISKTFHEQLLSLGIDSEFSFVWLPDEDKHEHLFWATWVNEKNGAAQYQSKAIKYPLDKTEPGTAKCYTDWESGQTVHETYVPPDQINSFFAVWEELLRGAEQFKPHLFPEGIYYTEAYMKYGCFGIDIRRKLTSDEKEIIRRFAVEFERTYTRFLDLQKAEAQARESRIEAALEKVRSKTMSMQSSDELADTAAVVFQQLINLGIEPNRIYITIIKDESGDCEFWITDEDGSKVSSAFNANLNHNNSFQKMYAGWKENKKSILIDMQGKELQDYFKYLSGLNIPFKGGLSQKRRLQYIAYFSKGFIGVASPDETKLETIQLLERFAAVFNLTYTRFNDLKQAEAQNKIIQAENDRKTKELEDARQLQLSMLPKELPKLPHLDIAVYMKTATEVGGDYYDFNIDGNGTLTVVVGDATGHGMMSGMMVSIMKSFFISNRNSINLKEFFENTNNSFKEMHLGRMMMPLIGVQINSEKIIATNAGMPSLLYFRNKSQKAGEFVSNNLPLGGMKGTDYLLKAVRYEKGDTILLMSDGFAELKNSHNEQYGYLRIKEKFRSLVHKSSGEIIEELKTTASHWTNGAEPDDDVTFVVIKFQ